MLCDLANSVNHGRVQNSHEWYKAMLLVVEEIDELEELAIFC